MGRGTTNMDSHALGFPTQKRASSTYPRLSGETLAGMWSTVRPEPGWPVMSTRDAEAIVLYPEGVRLVRSNDGG